MGIVQRGIHVALEAEANRLIKESMAGDFSHSGKRDVLTPWKEKDRRDREVYSESGVVDAANRTGMYNRAYNARDTHLNSRDGVVRGRRTASALRTFVQEHGSNSFDDGSGD